MEQKVMTRSQVREFDRHAIEDIGIPGVVLMENAGKECARLIKPMVQDEGGALIFCGPGNNGGDGYVIARHLSIMGIKSKVVLVCEKSKIKGDALVNLKVIENMGLEVDEIDPGDGLSVSSLLNGASLIVDAIFGTGLQGEVREQYLPVIEIINAMPVNVFSVDIPSGLDCDTGMPLGDAIEANLTATFVALKQGFKNPDSKRYTGNVSVINIGI
jgi:NAD(P)H-hydrate epimerase